MCMAGNNNKVRQIKQMGKISYIGMDITASREFERVLLCIILLTVFFASTLL